MGEKQARPMRLVQPSDIVVVDELPAEDEELLHKEGSYELAADFLAFIRGSRILTNGELHLTVAVPAEFKWDALPLTDVRGVMFRMAVYKPVRESEEKTEREEEYPWPEA